MNKGTISLDAITAFIILIFLVVFIQKTTSSNLSISDNYGGFSQSKAAAIKLSSIMNSFYATSPSQNDSITGLYDYIKPTSFGTNTFTINISKQQANYYVNVTIESSYKNYSVSFPAVNETNFSQADWEISS